jgi:hypothetical protein
MAEGNYKKIEDKKKEFNDRWARMDADKDRYLLKPYSLTDGTGKSIKRAISITMPYPRIFAEHMFGVLISVDMQPRVECPGATEKEKAVFENFYIDVLTSIDADLAIRGLRPLLPFAIEEDCLKGTIGARLTLRQNDDKTWVPYLLPCDSRYLAYEFGMNGLEWAAPTFMKTPAMMQAEYPDAKIPSEKRFEVNEYWDKDVREVYVKGSLIHSEPNKWGYPPFVIVESAAGPNFMDDDFYKNKSESIFASVRDLFDEINRHASIVATIEMMSFRGSKMFKSHAGAAGELDADIDGMAETIPMDVDESIQLVPINDVYNASRLHQANLLSVYQQATFSNMEYGTLSIPLSSVAISQMLEKRSSIINHRIEDIKSFYTQTVRMFKDQYVEKQFDANVGKNGIEVKYTPDELSKQHFITYEMKPLSRQEDIANASIAQAYKNLGMSWSYTLENVLKVQDVNAELIREGDELSAKMDQAVTMFKQVFNLRDAGDALDDPDEQEKYYLMAELKLMDLENLLKIRASGRVTNLNPADVSKGNGTQQPILPSFGGGGGSQIQNIEGEGMQSPEQQDQNAQSRAVTVRNQTAEGG